MYAVYILWVRCTLEIIIFAEVVSAKKKFKCMLYYGNDINKDNVKGFSTTISKSEGQQIRVPTFRAALVYTVTHNSLIASKLLLRF